MPSGITGNCTGQRGLPPKRPFRYVSCASSTVVIIERTDCDGQMIASQDWVGAFTTSVNPCMTC